MDLTKSAIVASLDELKPHFISSDFASWSPKLCRKLGIKSMPYYTISPATVGYLISPTRKIVEKGLTGLDLMEPLLGFFTLWSPRETHKHYYIPSASMGFNSSSIKLRGYEARELASDTIREYGSGISFMVRQLTSENECDAIGFKTSREIDGPYCAYIEKQFEKPVILVGPIVSELPNKALEERWKKLLSSSQAQTVIFCAFGSECVLNKDQFQELVLGLELTGLPFLVALKPPMGAETTESALPEGFQDGVKGRRLSICALLPHIGDQIINARLMAEDLKVGVEVEKGEEDGLFSKDDVCKAVMTVMDDD
ncbi:hypothetical protein CRYUN_Cryun32bG0045200 [Craigia yunnanensis]